MRYLSNGRVQRLDRENANRCNNITHRGGGPVRHESRQCNRARASLSLLHRGSRVMRPGILARDQSSEALILAIRVRAPAASQSAHDSACGPPRCPSAPVLHRCRRAGPSPYWHRRCVGTGPPPAPRWCVACSCVSSATSAAAAPAPALPVPRPGAPPAPSSRTRTWVSVYNSSYPRDKLICFADACALSAE